MALIMASTGDVAEQLGVNEQRVRQLIASGDLDAAKMGGRWFVEPSSVSRLKESPRPAGRPFSTRMAWGVLFLADSEEPAWLAPAERWRCRQYLGRDGLQPLVPRLRRRADLRRLRVHPGVLHDLREEPGLVQAGVSAAGHYELGLVAVDHLEAYVPKDLAEVLIGRYRASADGSPNVLLRVVDEEHWHFADRSVAPPSVVAVDLLEAGDGRSRRAGRDLIHRRVAPSLRAQSAGRVRR